MKKLILLLAIPLILIACSKKEDKQIQNQNLDYKGVELLGAGATFPYPLYSKLFDTFYNIENVKVNYQSIGSGGGIRQLLNKTVHFGATDAFMTDEEISNAPKPIIHIPTCLGADVITYNLPNNPQLSLTPDLLADIFLGKITNWNDPRIKKINPDIKLPNLHIVVVHRSDGSGTTFIFSDYLSKVSQEWEKKVGRGKSLNWPTGLGGKGNEGVSGLVKQTPGSIAYVELIYAIGNGMPVAAIQNKSGNFIMPSIESVSQSANIELPEDTRISITNTDAPQGYPISSFTWLIIYEELNILKINEQQANALIKLLWWMTHDGQKLLEPLHYAPLPDAAVKNVEKLLKKIKFNGNLILNK